MTNRQDITAKRFGRLVVLGYVGGRNAVWECRCDCGVLKQIAGGALRSGATQSCGCLRRERTSERVRLRDMAGQRFGRLCVQEFTEMRSGESFWQCLCDCGASVEARGWALRSGGIRSCGCLHKDRIREPRTNEPTYSAIHSRLAATRGSARKQRCTDCGGRAEQWSYDHAGPDELVSALGHAYSIDLDHYDARCCSCHRVFDASHGGPQ